MKELFKIYRIDKNEAERIKKAPNTAHKHDFEELIIGLKGKLSHFIDYKVEISESPFISFVTKGKIHRAEPQAIDNQCDFWVIRFKSELIPETTFQLYNYYHNKANFIIQNPKRLDSINMICKLMLQEMLFDKPDLGIVKNLLSSLFSMIENERKQLDQLNLPLLRNQNHTFQSFLSILEENFRRPEGVNFYAEKLFTTAKTLNSITQNILQQSVSEIIETRKLIEAKNALMTTDKTINEIGFELGYTDKAYFTAVFKKKSGQTPTEFREEMKSIIS